MISAETQLWSVGKKTVNLFQLLHDRDVQTFKKRCSEKENKSHLDENDGKYTYLQYACLYGLLGAVEALLVNGANPNLTCHAEQCSPIMIAGRHGHFKVVELLAKQDNVNFKCTPEGTVLHAVLDGLTKAHETLAYSFDMKRHLKCLEYLMDKVKAGTLDINAQNVDGHTVLHLAVKLHEKRIIRLLLDNGAYIGARCNRKNMAISLIDANMFKEYLDDCVSTNGKLPIDDNYEIIYKYNFLVPPTVCQRDVRKRDAFGEPEGRGYSARALVSETEPLIELSKVPELRPLLKHPVLTSFLNLKWYTIRKYFWANFTFYVMFWLCLTFHTLVVYSPFDSKIDQLAITERRATTVAICTWYPSIVLCGLFILREFFQFGVSPWRYVCDVENLLDVALVVFNILILCCKVDAQYAAVSVLLTWTELVLLINRHPSLSPNIEMYMVVCKNFLKLLAWCSMLIVAFALSFYLVFKDAKDNPSLCTPPPDNATYNATETKFFDSPHISFFKVILMMTGEYEISSIPLDCHPGVSHVLFVLFVFLVVLVLFNLMNGLAVSDTQAIRSDAEIVGNVSRAKLIAYIEKMASVNPFTCLNIFDGLTYPRCCCCSTSPQPIKKGRPSTWRRPIRAFYERANLFPYVLPDSSAHVLPNLDNLVDLTNSDFKREHLKSHANNSCWTLGCQKYTAWYITRDIMNMAKEILVQRSDRNEQSMENCALKLEEYGKRLTLLEETTKKKLSELIELVKKKH